MTKSNRVPVQSENGEEYWVEIVNSEHPCFNQCIKLYLYESQDEPSVVSEFDMK